MAVRVSCSDASLEAGEEMIGTAPRVDYWLLVEYGQVWQSDALGASSIPTSVKERLTSIAQNTSNLRVELIKGGGEGEGLSFFVALSDERAPRLFKFSLDSYSDLLDIDIPHVLSSPDSYSAHALPSPLFLVCTHGTYDACCARLGLPLWRKLKAHGELCVWQATHVGGHRFAPNIVCLPHGIYYGRAFGEEALDLALGFKEGRLSLENLRGRSCHPREAQAAEYFLRRETGSTRIDDYAFCGFADEEAEGRRCALFEDKWGVLYAVTIRVIEGALKTKMNCADEGESLVARFALEGIERRS
jgi:hypothetical protein